MSTVDDKSVSTESAEAVVTPPAAASPPAAAPAKAPVAAGTQTAEPEFLKDRLDRERRSILKDLGIKLRRDEDPQERIDQYRADQDVERAESKDLKKKITAHETTISELAASKAAVKVFADMEFNALDEAQKAIVVAAAGEDPNERLKTIAIMKASRGAVAATAVVQPTPIPSPAQTGPGTPAPVPGTSTTTDVRAEHARLAASNPLAAAAFLLQNSHQYYTQK